MAYDADEYELTGWEEHERDEAWECGEVAAMRREAERELAMEAAEYEAMNQEYRDAYEAEQHRVWGTACSPRGPVCTESRWAYYCVESDIPF